MDKETWLKERKKGIGGSDAAAILGLNPYKTNVELWEEKVGLREPEDISHKDYVKYGTEAEDMLRKLFALDYPQYDVYHPDGFEMLWHPQHDFLFASLDGELIDKETRRRGILEIKTTNILQSMQKEKWNDQVPDNYYLQVLHYLLVTGWDFAVLKAQLKYDYGDGPYLITRHYHIERSEVEDDLKILLKAELEFWHQVELKQRPNLILLAI